MISVIVPIYGVEKYLRQCVESVLAQTFSDWELILVDDGSKDQCPEICDSYAQRDVRIRVLHIENGGLSHARNIGIDEARGGYIFFLDGDDMIHPRCLERLHSLLDDNIDKGVTIAEVGTRDFSDLEEVSQWATDEDKRVEIVSTEKAVADILYQTGGSTSVCGKLYRVELFEDLRFKEGIGYEDLELCHKLLFRCGRIVRTGEQLYLYRQNPDSYLHNFTPGRLDVLDVTDGITDYYRGVNTSLYMAARVRRFAAHCNMLMLIYANRRELKAQGVPLDTIKGWIARCMRVIKGERRMVLCRSEARLKDRMGALISYTGLLKFVYCYLYSCRIRK